MDKMPLRHSQSVAAPRRPASPRPRTHRERSNSFPIMDVLGCSTPEAQLIMAEGRAAVRSRQKNGGRRIRSVNEGITTFDPREHIRFLNHSTSADDVAVSDDSNENLLSPKDPKPSRHTRIPSNVTDRSTSTVVTAIHEPRAPNAFPGSPLGDYSSNLANFIRSQLNTIPTYTPADNSISPRSCPDLSFQLQTPPLSPRKAMRRHMDAPSAIEIPPIQPPARSAFSAWSSTDDETDDEMPSMPDTDSLPSNPLPVTDLKRGHYTPDVLGYYEAANESSFLFTSTPLDEEEPNTAKGFTFPDHAALMGPPAEPHSPTQADDYDYESSISTRPQLTSSSAPSLSSVSTSSYFECKRPISLAPQIRERIIAAVTPPQPAGKVFTAISPFEGAALANVHDVFVESQQRVLVDGMSFDMVRDFSAPDESMRRVQTPC